MADGDCVLQSPLHYTEEKRNFLKILNHEHKQRWAKTVLVLFLLFQIQADPDTGCAIGAKWLQMVTVFYILLYAT
jgi:hypothetical protein